MFVGILAFLVLVFLPGAWITCVLPLPDIPFWARLLIGVMIAPLIVLVQFYCIRLLGVPFEPTAILLVGLNLPALYFVYRRFRPFSLPDRRTILASLLVIVVIFVCIAPLLLDPQKRQYTWEAWSQADVTYMVANGDLQLEDAELVGVRLAYPWAGHVYQAVLSYLIGTPPVSNYIWANLIWLLFIFGFAAGIVAELGGNNLSRVMVAIWLSFGVNFVGYTIHHILPSQLVGQLPIWGDNRYTPWVDKVVFFGQMYFALGIFIALLYLMVKRVPGGFSRYHLAVIGVLLLSLGLIYPVLLPAAYALLGAKAIALMLDRPEGRQAIPYRQILALGIIMLVAGGVTVAYLRLLTESHVGEQLVSLNDGWYMLRTAAESVVVTFPLLLGFGLVALRQWKERHGALIIPGLGALASFLLYTLFNIPWYRNEYKFIFTAAICLAPFASLALEPMLEQFGRLALPLMTVVTFVLAAPLANNTYRKLDLLYTKAGPKVDLRAFDLRLDDSERFSGLCDAIRRQTPVNSILVIEYADVHFPTLTRRQLYVAPPQAEPHPGILITSDQMLTLVKGYDRQILEDRRSTLRELFDTNDAKQWSQSLDRILAFKRPVALIVDDQRHAALDEWLVKDEKARLLYQGDGETLWLVEPESGTIYAR